jgi:hypothetical protein
MLELPGVPWHKATTGEILATTESKVSTYTSYASTRVLAYFYRQLKSHLVPTVIGGYAIPNMTLQENTTLGAIVD